MLLSVVIPTCQRPDLLANCLTCIEMQTIPREDFEVIVSDDSRDTLTRDLLREKFEWVRWTKGPGRGPAANRNHGASEADGGWVVFLDDDCEPFKGWLASIASQSDVDVIEGKTVCLQACDNPFMERIENLRGGSYWSCNLAVRRDVFKRLGGFDEDFLEAAGEDMEFAWRIAKHQLHSRFLASAVVNHPQRRITWEKFWWRTWLIRWIILYRLKTCQSAPLGGSHPAALMALVKCEFANLLRSTLHFFLKFDPRLWRTNLFNLLWKWLTFPFVLPYLMIWEIRFRNRLRPKLRFHK
jgi:GT2 family glycosyltransferase